MLFRRIILFVRRLRSINGESGAAIDEDDEGDEDVGIFFAAFTFADIFLSAIINNVRETMFAYLIVFVASKFIPLSGTMVNGLYYTGMNTNDKMSQVEIIKAIFQHYFEAYIAWRLIRYVTLFLMGNNYEN
jgi:hypothetical protein